MSNTCIKETANHLPEWLSTAFKLSFFQWECLMTWYVLAVPFHDLNCLLLQPCMYLAWTGNWTMWIITPLRMDEPNQWRSRPTLWLQFLQMVTFQGQNQWPYSHRGLHFHISMRYFRYVILYKLQLFLSSWIFICRAVFPFQFLSCY